ncbi:MULTISPECIES: 3-(3-hydroxy-phenyl)propionate transporter MhpT [Rhizobium]|uniref:3-(3-hydroxy-phenyl)propionate transporter MhpT n=1 Tax=Rhizobium changzhiense TaxID=2692317 RepID=A0ABR6ACN5_9HYPH|nr:MULTISPECIES: 3-(3-hydroxy-phenyl)propionate transporter MhpT [Rhizobium]MBA5804386.1 3-(3-hydroxy-phenyl)propionate transporter MhpT [Rhizobium changzhiense]MCV9942647.1 3-(3-hydroxy-phenyl)propionate transporter MhpT [Rhizobium sp. BT-175]MCW0015392.1 3-(3-hydroxy-phenyl)propionate transporter MhpT [Rhizobium sp. BT-226]
MGKSARGISLQTSGYKVLILCFCAAMIEGFDIQAAGVAAPKLAPALGLAPGQMALFFSSATFGLIFGAIVGGRIADRFGRRTGLILSLLTFGLFSLGTALVGSFSALVLMRFLTGVGLGGALPNLVAIAAEALSRERRGTAVGLMYAGIPIGGAIASAVSILGLHDSWESIFVIGGILPVALVPVLLLSLPDLKVARDHGDEANISATFRSIFGPSSWQTTLLLWLGFFFSLLVLYLLLNWLPALMVAKGFSKYDAGIVQIVFNIGGAAGSLMVGNALDGIHRRRAVILSYGLLVAALFGVALLPNNLALAIVSGVLLGGTIIGVQAILYGLAPQSYTQEVRGTAVGFAVAAGRLGSVAGPLLAGALVAGGKSATEVLLGIVPIAILGGLASLLLVHRLAKAQNAGNRDAAAEYESTAVSQTSA